MMKIKDMIQNAMDQGYQNDDASAKVCQDIILKALSKSTLSRNATIKGGVVMRAKTNNARRATKDLDIDFIKYSLADESIELFIQKLNCLDGITIKKTGKIETLRQQDYSGKRVYVMIEDSDGYQISSKIDLGVHNRFEIEQEEYCFDLFRDDEGVSLLINSNEQMFAEKLRSLLRLGPISTRYKDVYDLYYLITVVDIEKLQPALNTYIFRDGVMREKESKDIIKRLEFTFRDKVYLRNLDMSDKRWIDDDIQTITGELLEFVRKL